MAAPRAVARRERDPVTLSKRFLTTSDAEAWRLALPTDACVMGSLEFMKIQEEHLCQTARLFVLEWEGYRVAYPFFLRPVPGPTPLIGPSLWDTASPEYTGPILLDNLGSLLEGLACPMDFPGIFGQFCEAQGIVAEFAHLNPWQGHLGLLDMDCITVNREIIYADLTLGEEAIWNHSLSVATRNQTRQAFRMGVKVRAAGSAKDVLAFHKLHHQTMESRQALENYFLPPEYFLKIYETMPQNSIFMLAEHNERLIAGGLIFHDSVNAYWHLSAMDREHSKLRPVNAYLFETIKGLARAGRKRLIFGGGYQPGDGIFKFKAGFSPLRAAFEIYRRVHAPRAYAALNKAWSQTHGGLEPSASYFPSYRSRPTEAEASGTTPGP
jgi:hypothetical protein